MNSSRQKVKIKFALKSKTKTINIDATIFIPGAKKKHVYNVAAVFSKNYFLQWRMSLQQAATKVI